MVLDANLKVTEITAMIEACKALPGFQPTLVGGDGNAVQICELQHTFRYILYLCNVGSLRRILAYPKYCGRCP